VATLQSSYIIYQTHHFSSNKAETQYIYALTIEVLHKKNSLLYPIHATTVQTNQEASPRHAETEVYKSGVQV
jgi:hypothetical protein